MPAEEHVVAAAGDIPDGGHVIVRIGRREIGVFNIRGRFHALPNLCPHQTGPLWEAAMVTGTLVAGPDTGWRPQWGLEGEVIACPWHGLEYHVPTGRCLAFPEIRLRRYDVQVRDGSVVIRL